MGSSFFLLADLHFLTGGQVAGGGTCTFDVQLQIPASATPGNYINATSFESATRGGVPNVTLPRAIADLTVNTELLEITKEFIDDPVLPGGTVDLTFTITNLHATHQVDNITFADDFENMLTGTTLLSIESNNCAGSTINGTGTGTMTFVDGSLTAGSNCTFTVRLQLPAAAEASNITNTTGEITGDVGGVPVTGGTATDVLQVRTLSLVKAFGGPGVSEGTVTISFTLTNLDISNFVTDIDFFDELSTMLPGATVLTLPADVSDCGESATVSGTGTSTFSFMEGALIEGGSCSFEITVQLPCAGATGMYPNTTSVITGSSGGGNIEAPSATDSLDFTGAAAATFTKPVITIYMDADCNFDSDTSLTGGVTDIMHACCVDFDTTFMDVLMLNGCSGTGTIERTWTVTDCNAVTTMGQLQTITVADTTRPTIVCPPMVGIACTDSTDPMMNMSLGMATGMDNCDMAPMVTYDDDDSAQTMNGSCSDHQYTIIRTWTATDACMNESFTCDQTINVKDEVNPTVVCFPTLTIDLNSDREYDLTPAEVFDNGSSSDNCGGTVTATGVTPNHFTCDDLGEVVVTLTAIDACGNPGSCTSTVTVDDSIYPCCPPTHIIYVNQNTPDDDNGWEWATAFANLQDALELAAFCSNVTEIWVAGGYYSPDQGINQTPDDRNASFVMLDGIAIYGGFMGNEINLGDRDWMNNTTVLSGAIGDGKDPSDNSYHVINNKGSGTTSTAILDGFIVEGGNANGLGDDEKGGGMLNEGASPTVVNCLFAGNSADFCGGAIFNKNSSSTIDSCGFIYNGAEIGGGIHNGSNVAVNINYCFFESNMATINGGAIFNNTAMLSGILNCHFEGNSAGTYGGAIYNLESSPDITNSAFIGNSADEGSGIANQSNSSPAIVNCSMHGNTATGTNGGVIRNLTGTAPLITNCILWGNGLDEIVNAVPGATVSYSIVEQASGVYPGTGNGNEDPMFVSATDLHISPCSPAVNAGNNAANGSSYDLDGNMRIVAGIIDMGAYESQINLTVPITWDGGAKSMYWNDAYNWDSNTVPLPCQDVIIPGGNNVIIQAGNSGFGATLDVQSGAELTTDPTGVLCIENE